MKKISLKEILQMLCSDELRNQPELKRRRILEFSHKRGKNLENFSIPNLAKAFNGLNAEANKALVSALNPELQH